MHDHREPMTAPRAPTSRGRLTVAAVNLARHGRRFTGAILITAAVVGVGIGVAAPEISPVTPTTTAVSAAAPAQATDQTVADGVDTGRDGGGRVDGGARVDGGRGAVGGGGRR